MTSSLVGVAMTPSLVRLGLRKIRRLAMTPSLVRLAMTSSTVRMATTPLMVALTMTAFLVGLVLTASTVGLVLTPFPMPVLERLLASTSPPVPYPVGMLRATPLVTLKT